jgi:hypothetical protein
MKAAIDIDGTLAARSGVPGPLTHALSGAGWDVVLLTGHSCPDPAAADRVALAAGRLRQVAPFRAAFREVVIRVGRSAGEVAEQKAAYCRDNGVALFVDNSPNCCEAVRKASPGTLVLEVRG